MFRVLAVQRVKHHVFRSNGESRAVVPVPLLGTSPTEPEPAAGRVIAVWADEHHAGRAIRFYEAYLA